MKTNKRRTGDQGEAVACRYLERQGFRIVARNYSKPWGEIDIVAEKGSIVHFIEVKTISREIEMNSGSREIYKPEDQLTALKLKKVARTAELYMDNRRDRREFQIDAVTVILDTKERIARCAYYPQVL